MKRGIALFAVMTLILTICMTAMGQERPAPAGRIGTVSLRDTTAAEQPTEAPAEDQGMTMWDLTLIGLGIAVALLVILFIMAITSKKDVERKDDGPGQQKK